MINNNVIQVIESMFLTRSQGQHATQSARHRLIKKNSIQVILLSRDKRHKFYLWIYVLIA